MTVDGQYAISELGQRTFSSSTTNVHSPFPNTFNPPALTQLPQLTHARTHARTPTETIGYEQQRQTADMCDDVHSAGVGWWERTAVPCEGARYNAVLALVRLDK